MATYKKQLQDKDGNTIYPDVGIDLDNVVYSDDPTAPTTVTPWVNTNDIQDGAVTSNKIDSTTFASASAINTLNQSQSWSAPGDIDLLSVSINLSSPSNVYINGSAAAKMTTVGARLVISVDNTAVLDQIYSSQTSWVTLVSQKVVSLSSGAHTIVLSMRPDGISGAAGTVRDFSLVAFQI